MIDLYFAPTPNGMKLKLFFAETGIAHQVMPVSLSGGEQHRPEFLAISPNGRIPALVDHTPADGGAPLTMFESGAMLLYLARKHRVLLPADPRRELESVQWLFWQMSGLGPMAGQAGYFRVYAREQVPFAIERYTRETHRLYSVLDGQLRERDYIAGEYSIADIACYPWIVPHAAHGQDLAEFPDLRRWYERMSRRPAVARTYDGVEDVYARPGRPVAGAAQ